MESDYGNWFKDHIMLYFAGIRKTNDGHVHSFYSSG